MWDLVQALFVDSYIVHAMSKGGAEGQGNFL